MYKELVEYVVKNLVSMPEEVQINSIDADGKMMLKVKVAKEDMGRVIGKDGRIIRSIREIANAYASKNHEKVSVDVEEIKKENTSNE